VIILYKISLKAEKLDILIFFSYFFKEDKEVKTIKRKL